MDEYVAVHLKPTFLKIDVEGAEKMVLEGAKKFLRNNAPVISMEVWRKDKNGDISMEAVKLLRELGYCPHFITSEGEMVPARGNILEQITLGYENIIFTRVGS